MAFNNQGICLPEFKCRTKKIAANGVMRSGDECEDDLVEKVEDGKRRCVDPDMVNITSVPDEIKFKLNKDSCDIFAFEVYSNNTAPLGGNVANSGQVTASTSSAQWQGSPIVSVLKWSDEILTIGWEF